MTTRTAILILANVIAISLFAVVIAIKGWELW